MVIKMMITICFSLFLLFNLELSSQTIKVFNICEEKKGEKEITSLENFKEMLDYIKKMKEDGNFPERGIKIFICGDEYKVSERFIFTEEHSGEEGKPIMITVKNKSVISGGIQIKNFKKLNGDVKGKIKKDVQEKLYVADLKDYGLKSLPPLELGGFGSLRLRERDRSYKGYTAFPYVELFFNGQPMILARHPNEGFIHVAGVEGEPVNKLEGFSVMKDVVLKVELPLAKLGNGTQHITPWLLVFRLGRLV